MNSKSFAFLSLLATLTTTLPVWADITEISRTLTSNEVYTAVGTLTIPEGVKVGLAGYKLSYQGVTAIAGKGEITGGDSTIAGCLELNTITKDSTISDLLLSGNLRLLKTGVKQLGMSKTTQTYTGGTEVDEGTLKLTLSAQTFVASNGNKPLGAVGSEITVNKNGTLDVNGKYGFKDVYDIVLKGGRITSGGQRDSTTSVFNPNLTLTADSTFELTEGKIYSFAANADLGGKTLTMNLGAKVHWLPSAVENGTVKVTGASTFQVDETATYSGLTLDMGAPMDLQAHTLGVKNYIATYTGADNKGTGALQVSGIFTPNSDNFFPPTMMNGSTIDLSAKEGPWAAEATAFANGATIAIEVGSRSVSDGDMLVKWSGTDYNGRTFNLTSNGEISEDFGLQPQAGGLKVLSKSTAIPTAVWTGKKSCDALDPDNWTWWDAEGHPSLPDGTYAVKIAWDKLPNLNWPETNALSFATVEFFGEKPTEIVVLEGDRDWRGLGGIDVPFAIDLNGKTLAMTFKDGTSAEEYVVSSSEDGGVLIASVAEGKKHDNTQVSFSGKLTLVKDGPGTFVATKCPQEYDGVTIVSNGVLKCQDNANVNSTKPFGSLCTVDLVSSGILDPAGSYNWGNHVINACGGMISNTVERNGLSSGISSAKWENPFNPTINLQANLVFAATETFNFQGRLIATEEGRELNVRIGIGKKFVWYPVTADNITLNVSEGGYLVTMGKMPIAYERMKGTTLRMAAAFDLGTCSGYPGGFAVGNYIAEYIGTANEDNAQLSVYGVFAPNAVDVKTGKEYFRGCTMMDGSTIDLSSKSNGTPWSTKSAMNGVNTVTFAEGAEVTIEVGDREFKGTTQIVEWSEGSKASAAKATFVLSAAAKAKGYSLSREEDGLYVSRKGMMLLLR